MVQRPPLDGTGLRNFMPHDRQVDCIIDQGDTEPGSAGLGRYTGKSRAWQQNQAHGLIYEGRLQRLVTGVSSTASVALVVLCLISLLSMRLFERRQYSTNTLPIKWSILC
jgi:hypothetical protein